MSYNYEKEQIERINWKSDHISIQVIDFEGNRTNNLTLSPELINLIASQLQGEK